MKLNRGRKSNEKTGNHGGLCDRYCTRSPGVGATERNFRLGGRHQHGHGRRWRRPHLEQLGTGEDGVRSLKFWEDPITGTPQAFVWWVTGLTDGDTIDASFYVYDMTPATNPSGRIWAHYTSDPSDILTYAGSASGNSTYSAGTGWDQLSFSWTFDSDFGARDGFVVEARLYSGDLTTNTIYIDDAAITVSSDTAVIYAPDGSIVPVELQSFSIE